MQELHLKQKRGMTLLVTLILITGMLASTSNASAAEGDWDGGDGSTKAEAIIISDTEGLAKLAADVNGGNDYEGKYFKLGTDIDLAGFDAGGSGEGWMPIGTFNQHPFKGHFDGNDHVVKNMVINRLNANFVALFGYVEGSTIENLGVIDGNINGRSYVAGLVGYSLNGTMIDCYNTSKITGLEYVGGVIAANGGTMEGCYNSGDVSGYYFVGGLNSASEGGAVTNCYNTGPVSGNLNVGGLIGASAAPIKNCYNAGAVAGHSSVGGMVGTNYDSVITDCYYNSDQFDGPGTGENKANLGNYSATALTTIQMIAPDVLSGDMSGLGNSVWKKRPASRDYVYYPELVGFANNAHVEIKADSQESVQVARRTPILDNLATKNYTYGQTLSSFAPSCTATDPLNGKNVTGRFAWVDGTTRPAVKNSGYLAIFTPGSELYKKVDVSLSVNVTAKAITVIPDKNQSKEQRSPDPKLAYTVSPGLEPGDQFTGALSRKRGENVGTYQITMGDLSAGDNYLLTLSPEVFRITKAVTGSNNEQTNPPNTNSQQSNHPRTDDSNNLLVMLVIAICSLGTLIVTAMWIKHENK